MPSTKGTLERMTTRICILDYGMGNLRSVEKALEHVGATATIANDAATIRAADGLILPGVGAFPKAMEGVRELGLDELIAERRDAGVPILGICLGLQLLFDSTTELGGAEGLGLLPGGSTSSTARPQDPAHRLVAGPLGEGVAADRGDRDRDALLLRPLLRAAARSRTICSAPPPTAPASPARPSATTSSASSSTPRSRAPPACGCSPTSPGSAPGRSPRRDPLSGDRHPRRPGGAPAAGRLRARDDLRRRPGRRSEALGRRRRRVPARRRPRRRQGGRAAEPRGGAADRRGGRLPDPGRRRAARRRVGRGDARGGRGAGRDRHGRAARSRVSRRDAGGHGERVVVSVDARDGRVALAGWTEAARRASPRPSPSSSERGVARFLCTAIEVDGTMEGPAIDELQRDRGGNRARR